MQDHHSNSENKQMITLIRPSQVLANYNGVVSQLILRFKLTVCFKHSQVFKFAHTSDLMDFNIVHIIISGPLGSMS